MEVACEVQVYLLHREHLGIATACSAALDAEARAERRFAQGYNSLFPYFVQSQCQADTHGGFADTCLCWADGCH